MLLIKIPDSSQCYILNMSMSNTMGAAVQDGCYAWAVCAATFLVLVIQGGLIYSMGVFYIMFKQGLDAGDSALSLVTSLNYGILFLIGPFVGILTEKYGERPLTIIGAFMATLGLACCSFATQFILTGSFGIVSSRRKTTCFIVTSLVLAILSAVISIGILMTSLQGIILSSSDYYYLHYDYNVLRNYVPRQAVMGINAILTIMALVQVVEAIVSSAFSCHGLCGGNQAVVMAGQVQYVQGPDGQQQMVILPFSHQGAGHKYKMQLAPPVVAPMVVSTIQTPQRKEHYMSKCVLGLSVTQIIIGALCIVFQVVLINMRSPMHSAGQGIWTGLFFVLTGSFGIVSSRRKTTCIIVTFLVLAIISAVIAIGILMVSPQEIIMSTYCYGRYSYNTRCVPRHAVIGINVVLIIMALVQAVLAIVSSAFSCHGLCGGNRNQSVVVAGQVQYVQGPDGQQQMVILPFSQQGAGQPAGPSSNPVQTQLPAYNQSPPPTYECETKLPIPE